MNFSFRPRFLPSYLRKQTRHRQTTDSSNSEAKWSGFTVTLLFAAVSVTAAVSVYLFKKKTKALNSKLPELEASLKSSLEKCASERQGRIRAQQSLRKALAQPKSENVEMNYYPMAPIGIIQSCFTTRNGTPRQPLLVPLARASLIFNTTRVPPSSLEGLAEYSHCWVIYVFHLNTDLEKLWNHPSKSKFKAKVRVPRLQGGRKGVFATRSPHRPCPIGLTVAKVEAVQGNKVLLSGVDLVDGTPVLDVKPYLPYSDGIVEAKVPNWLMEDNLLAVASISFSEDFTSTLENCWRMAEKKSLYASAGEFQSLIKQVLSWDIRSVSQRKRPHDAISKKDNDNDALMDDPSDIDGSLDEAACMLEKEHNSLYSNEVIYHLILEGLDVSYRIDDNSNVIVEKVSTFAGLSNDRNFVASLPTSPTSVSQGNDLLTHEPRISISNIANMKELSSFVIRAEIKKVEKNFGWYYEGCNNYSCGAKLKSKVLRVSCHGCQRPASGIVLKYKIHFMVADDTGTTSVVLFDGVASRLLNKSAKLLKDELIAEGRPDSFPDEFEDLVGRTFVMKLRLSEYNSKYRSSSISVQYLSDDADVIGEFTLSDPQNVG
ncbi:uncharacterized protein LOC114732266 isoform X2 [Neltuma alba]|uniref:uncharacterized protein LOC114732266 isoform X2 n=1 Tax=Neltuma alba TaxID=207710 RepID=UPI0010A554B5|nr:uncharacterized protein LOC114732266 isoform X2 [Prosopis alba]